MPAPHPRLRIGRVWVDALTFDQALVELEKLVDRQEGGAVFTPNVDHVIKAESNDAFREAYNRVQPVAGRWHAARLGFTVLGCPLPERVAGSDILRPALELAARRRWRVYLLGGAPGVAEAVATLLTNEMGIIVAGWDDCRIESDGSDPTGASIRARESGTSQISSSSRSARRSRSSGFTDRLDAITPGGFARRRGVARFPGREVQARPEVDGARGARVGCTGSLRSRDVCGAAISSKGRGSSGSCWRRAGFPDPNGFDVRRCPPTARGSPGSPEWRHLFGNPSLR